MAGSGTAHLHEDSNTVLEVRNLVVEYAARGGQKVSAVSDLSIDVLRGETLGLVGESGCGKSTLAKTIMRLQDASSGSIRFENSELTNLSARDVRKVRRRLQMIFQDPISSLNPRRTVRDLVAEGLSINTVPKPWDKLIDEVLLAVGLEPGVVSGRRARELSGGQCQRVAIARALLLTPTLVVCDEPVSALDVSIQAQILNLLEDMKAQYSLTLMFIAHDLAVVKNISDRVAVMYLGKLCEIAPSDDLFRKPLHPYTRALVSAIPQPDPFSEELEMLARGDLPSPMTPPSGCRFRTRCPQAAERCRVEEPQIREATPNHFVACHFPG